LNVVFVLLFRGVGGATQLPTGPLRQALTAAGFENAATYINSGNAVVRTSLPRALVIETVANICRKEFGFTKAIHALALEEWSDLIAANPFPTAVSAPKFLHAAVLAKEPQQENIEAIQAIARDGEGFAVVGKVAYIHTPGGFGQSKMAERFDRLIGVENTARNWNTVLKLEQLARKAR
jgi:uncharacterized protein (DUF1697 family)